MRRQAPTCRPEWPVTYLLQTLTDADVHQLPVVDEQNYAVVMDTMHQTVSTIQGTAHKAFIGASYSSAGKTGTAQIVSIAQDAKYDAESLDERQRDNAMYLGYAPAENPSIIIVVALENAGGGGSNAAPIARQIMDYYFTAGVNRDE